MSPDYQDNSLSCIVIKWAYIFLFNQPKTNSMKTFNHSTRTFFILLCLLVFTTCKKEKDPVIVTLTVNTSQLGEQLVDPPGCTLSATPSSVVIFDDGNPKNFTILVKDGTEIEWEGVTSDGGDVDIKKIIYKGGTNIFDKDSIPGIDDKGKEKVKVKVKRKTALNNDYVYKIKFKVKNKERIQMIDPKIQVN